MELTTSWQYADGGTYNNVGGSNVHANTRLYLRYDNRDISNNRDTIYWQIRAVATPDKSWATYGYGYDESYSIYDGSTARASGVHREGNYPNDLVTNTERVVASGSWVQSHNADGNWSTTLTYNGHVYGSAYTRYISVSLPMIPRKATISTAPDFNDEENPTITYSNLAGNSVSSLQACISLTGSNDDIPYRDISKTGSSYTFNLTEAERRTLRQACSTNSRTVYFYVKTGIGGNTYYSFLGKTLSIVNGNPTFNDFTYADTNSNTIALTGNNQNIIKDYSNVTVTISTANKAVANKEATMSKYRFMCGNSSADANYSSNTDVDMTLNNIPNGLFNVFAIDSRDNSKMVSKLANQVIEYSEITKGNISVSRSNGVSEETTLSFGGTWWNNNFRDDLIKSLNVGDILSKTKLKLDFSNLTYSDVYNAGIPGYTVLAKSDNGYQIELAITSDPRLGDNASVEVIYVENNSRNYIDTLWLAYSDETVETNLTEYDLSTGFGTPIFTRPADFGKLTQVDSNCLIYSMVKFENTVNNTLSAIYKYKKSSESNWINGTTLITLTKNNNNYSFSGLIAGDEGNQGFDINNSYDIQVIVEDELSSVIFTATLTSGIPHIAYAKNGVSIMGKYNDSVGGLLQVGGQKIESSDTLPIGAIVDYDGDTVPDGYEQVNKNVLEVKTLFAGGVETSNCVTAVGAVATLSESFRNFDLIFIRIGTRVWTWTSKYEMLLASKINIGTGSNVRFVIPYSCYQGGTIYTMELGFTSETTLQIYYNSCVNTSGNGGYISEIYGVKFNTL